MPFVLQDAKDSINEKLRRDPDFSEGQSTSEATRSHLDDKHVIDHFDVDDVVNVQKNLPGFVIELIPSQDRKENILKSGVTSSQT